MTLQAQLGIMVRGFQADPTRYGVGILHLMRDHPEEFNRACLSMLRDAPDTPGITYLLATLGSEGRLIPMLLLLAQSNAPAASRIADISMRNQAGLYRELIQSLNAEADESLLLAYIRILEDTAHGLSLMPVLRKLMESHHPKVRSKAALLMGRAVLSEEWFASRMKEEDGRVRANAIEALWNVDLPRRRAVFELATQDSAPRVAANGWIGLYELGAVESLAGLIEMAGSDDAGRRSSAAWAMGWARDARFRPTLQRMHNDPDCVVQANASKALERLDAAIDQQPCNGRLTFVRSAPGHLEFLLEDAAGNSVTDLRPIDVLTSVDGTLLTAYSIEAVTAPLALSVTVVRPDLDDGNFLRAIREVLYSTRPADDWKVAVFDTETARDRPSAEPQSEWADVGQPLTSQRYDARPGRAAVTLIDLLFQAVRASGAQRKTRHILSVLPPAMPVPPWTPDQFAQFAAQVRASGIVVHVISEAPVSPELLNLCNETGGFLMRVESLGAAGSLIEDFASALVHRWRLRFDSGSACRISIAVAAGDLRASAVAILENGRSPD
jgi:HEAT repeat protein